MSEFVKDDKGKPRPELIPTAPLWAVARVLAYGAAKYSKPGSDGAHNWRKGAAWSRYYGALQRHLLAWWGGEHNDPETGESHLSHALCCLLFLSAYEAEGLGTDDRPGKEGEK